MDHVAIMKPSWKLIKKILSGKKTIESRWYLTRRSPWNMAHKGDRVFFRDSGAPVTAMAIIDEVLQFEMHTLEEANHIVKKYGKEICLVNRDPKTWGSLPRYCILMRLKNPQPIAKPFFVNKKGFGSATAWMTVEDIDDVKLLSRPGKEAGEDKKADSYQNDSCARG